MTNDLKLIYCQPVNHSLLMCWSVPKKNRKKMTCFNNSRQYHYNALVTSFHILKVATFEFVSERAVNPVEEVTQLF